MVNRATIRSMDDTRSPWPPFRCMTCGEDYPTMAELRYHKATTGHPASAPGALDDPAGLRRRRVWHSRSNPATPADFT